MPPLLTARGAVGADTKPYLYLDPGRLLAGAPYMWLKNVGLGTVPHQNIGYLWPMGPFFWVFDTLGVPDWIAQRLWISTILFAAGIGVRYLLRAIGWDNGGIFVASVAYMLSPYSLSYVARISVLLLPWAGLPWMIGLAAKSLRVGGWRYPAAFALVAFTIGGTNATSLLLLGLGPVLWILHAWLADDEINFGRAAKTALRIALPTAATALWWIAGLRAQGAYGPNVLRYTETYRVVADSSTATEVFRGLGYWFFYGNDRLGQWIEPSISYTNNFGLLILSFGLPILALAAGAFTRWKNRAFFLMIVVVGGLIAVGGHPYEDSSVLGNQFTSFTRTDAGLALRSTPRATPLLILGTAVLLGAGVAALARWRPKIEVALRFLLLIAIVANLPPLWNGDLLAKRLQRPEDIPAYWRDAVAELDSADHATRILEVPGSDFASYRWGNTVEPITPGLTDRPYVARELVPFGSEPAADLLIQLDKGFQEDLYSPESLAAIARLMGVGDIVFRADLQYERYRTPRPRETWADLLETPGLAAPRGFGEAVPNVAGSEQTLLDELELATSPNAAHPPPVALFEVEDPLPITRTRSAERPLIVAGDAAGLVAAAATGLVEPDQLVVFSASFADDMATLEDLAGPAEDSAVLVVTDSNQRQARRWGNIRENTGYIERADEVASYDPSDFRLDLFPGATSDSQTVAVHQAAVVTASAYGNQVTYTVDDRPTLAIDGDPDTAWRVAAFDDPRGESLLIELTEPATIDHIDLLQPVTGIRNRTITQLLVRMDGEAFEVQLDKSSVGSAGQRVELGGPRTVQTIELEILATDAGQRSSYLGLSGVGFAEVKIPGVDFSEVIRLPTDLLSSIDQIGSRPVAVVLTRIRSDAREPVRTDGEEAMLRRIELPEPLTVELSGEARISAYASDRLVNDLLVSHAAGAPPAPSLRAASSSRLPGDVASFARSAFDGDPSSLFATAFGPQAGGWLEFSVDSPMALAQLDFDLVVDGRHSVPTRVDLLVDGETVESIALPDISGIRKLDESVPISLAIDPARGSTFRLVFSSVKEVTTKDWYSGGQIAMPIAISEWHTPVATADDRRGEIFETGCRRDLIKIDGKRIRTRVTGLVADAIERRPLRLELCKGESATLKLASGSVDIATARGRDTGIDIDRLLLRTPEQTVAERSSPPLSILSDGRVSTDVRIEAAGDTTEPFWLVLGQSFNKGWRATSPQLGDLGPPTLVDGFANGWLIEPSAASSSIDVQIEWMPQRGIWAALAATVVAAMACVALVLLGRRDMSAPPFDDPRIVSATELATVGSYRSQASAKIVLTTVGVAGFAALNLPSWRLLSVLVGALFFVSLTHWRGQRLLPWLAASCLVVAGAFTTIVQFRNRFVADFGWPELFDQVHVISVLALVLLAAELVRIYLADPETPAGHDPVHLPTQAER